MQIGRSSSTSSAQIALGVLMTASIVSLLDRQILSLLLIPIRADLGISDTQVSLLQGLAFAALYAVAGLPIGFAVDRINRRNIVIAGVLFWSIATALCGLATSFGLLFLARVGVGLGEACLHPSAYSMISDYFSQERRGRAYSLFGGAATIGISISLFAGAMLITVLGKEPITVWPFGTLAPWRVAFLLASLPGVLVALALLFVKEPVRQETASPMAGRSGERFLPFLKRRRGVVLLVFGAYGLINFAGYGVLAWMAVAYVRVYALSLADAGWVVGGIMLIASIVGALTGGALADRWQSRSLPGGRFRVAALSGLLGSVSFFLWWGASSFAASLLFGICAFTCQVAATSTAPAVIADLAPNRLRGQLSALYLLMTGFGGIAAGPTAIAAVSDGMFGGGAGLRWSLMIVPAFATLCAALLAWMGRHYFSRVTSSAAAFDGHTSGLSKIRPSLEKIA